MRAFLPAALACAALLSCDSDPPPRTGPVTVTFTDSAGAPVVGVHVVFHRPDGAVQELSATDESGTATAVITEGALVTVQTDYWVLTTVAAVEPGDDLVLAWGRLSMYSGLGTVAFPGPVDGASSYRVVGTCTSAASDGYQSELWVPLYAPACGTSLDMVALAHDPGGALLAYATALGVPVTGTPPDETASATLGAWQNDIGTVAIDATNAPAGSRSLSASLELRRGGRPFWDWSPAHPSVAIAPGGSASLARGYPAGFAGRLRTTLSYGPPDGPEDGRAWIVEADATLASRSIDLSAALPPRLSLATLSYGGGTPEASWKQSGADPALDAVLLLYRWTVGTDYYFWQVIAPPGTTSFAYPALPAELAVFESDASAGSPYLTISAYDASETVGYAAFKRMSLILDGVLRPPESAVLRGTDTHTVIAP